MRRAECANENKPQTPLPPPSPSPSPTAVRQLVTFGFDESGPPQVVIDKKTLQELEIESSSRKLSHVVTVIGDAESGKTQLLEMLIKRKTSDLIPATSGITLQTHTMSGVLGSTESYNICILDTEGVNNSNAPPAQRIACNQLLKHMAVKQSNVIIYVWNPTGENHPGSFITQAYQHLIELMGRQATQSTTVKRHQPALLIALNKMPLRHCYRRVLGDYVPISSDICTADLLEVDKTNKLGTMFSIVKCCCIPLSGSKWRPPRQRDLLGSALIPTMIHHIEETIHSLLVSQHLYEQQYVPRAILSQSGWVASLLHIEELINNLVDRWSVPLPLTTAEIKQWNEEGRIARSKIGKRKQHSHS